MRFRLHLDIPPAIVDDPNPARVSYVDAMRVGGALAVIVIHVTGDGDSAVGTLPFRSWAVCATLEALSRWAVPIFVMVSGLLLLDNTKQETPGQFYGKRLRRLAIPAIAWSLFYLIWQWQYEGARFSVGSAVYQLISGGAYYHLWFLSMLLGLYIVTPGLRFVVNGMTYRQLCWTTGTLLAMAVADAVVRANLGSGFTFVFQWCPFVALFLLGYCFRSCQWSRNATLLGFAAWIIGAALSVIGTFILIFHCKTSGWDIDDRLFLIEDEFSPSVLLMSVGVFVMFASWYQHRQILVPSKAVQTLSAASLGIYLAHPLFLSLLNGNSIDYEWHGIAVGIPLMVAVAATGATALSFVLGKIPWIKQIV